jgi:tRNA 2-thiocytidine biosynthesis protein TtcA
MFLHYHKTHFFSSAGLQISGSDSIFSAIMDKQFKKLCRIAGETIVKYRLIADGDRIMVGASGGKDSFMLLHLLEHLQSAAPVHFEFIAATFDPQFPEFNVENIAAYCRQHNWEHHRISVNIPAVITDKDMAKNPCMLCSRLRRGHLYRLAAELNCGKLALGQHLDDIISSFLMSLCRGQGLTSMAPKVVPDDPAHPVVIRPLALVPEALVKAAAGNFDFPTAGECIYKDELAATGDRAWAKELIKNLTERIPDLRSLMLKSMGRVELEWLLDKRYLNLNQ